MLNRRKRIVVHCHLPQTLDRIREVLGRSVEFVVAGDMPTLEAALRLYRQVAGLVIEKKPSSELPMAALRLAADVLPATPRVVLVDYEATSGVHTAVSCGLVTQLVLIPFSPAELAGAVGVDLPQQAVSPRLRAYPPLTGGMSASSSPAASE